MYGNLVKAVVDFDAMVEGLVAKKFHRAKEVLRARDQFLQAVYLDEDPVALESYFMQFAIAVRNQR